MKVHISWKFGGDSISISDAESGEYLASADGGHAKSAIFAALKMAGVSPGKRRLNDCLGTSYNPAPLGVARFWEFEAELTEETVVALRQAQALVDAEYEEWHQEALARIRAEGFHIPGLTDSVIAELVKRGLKDTLHVVAAPANDACVYWQMTPEQIISITDDPEKGMALEFRRDDGGVAYFWEKYHPGVIRTILRHSAYALNICYARPTRNKR